MVTFEATSNRGDKVVVEAADEQEARTKAMTMIWGPPRGMYSGGYKGVGLMIREVEETTKR